MFEELKKFLVEELRVNPDDVKPEAELSADLGINSLELADLVYLCEERFDVVIDEEELHNFTTVGDIVKYLDSKQG
jgi:acyl carrier protein